MASDGQWSIFGGHNYLEAVRASGFRTTAEALFELVDNSIEAGAHNVEVFAVSVRDLRTGRMTLSQIAVLDDGCGMDSALLRRSLRFGDGNRFARRSMGRFGVGLPQASLHQANEIKVWSWQAGQGNALGTGISAPKIQQGVMDSVPDPELDGIPGFFSDFSILGLVDSGTLVLWEDLHRANSSWKSASALFTNLAPLVGRVYRRFLTSHTEERGGAERAVTVTLIPIEFESGEFKRIDENVAKVEPLDPMYLMRDTSSDESFGPGPMFEEDELSPVPVVFEDVEVIKRDENGQVLVTVLEDHTVTIRCSVRKAHAADRYADGATWPLQPAGGDPGNIPWGKEADKQQGVSVMRADRELELQTAWRINYDPIERWWGIEVSFPPELDEIMGVTNQKQEALVLKSVAGLDLNTLCEPNENKAEMLVRLREENPGYAGMLLVRQEIENFLTTARKKIRDQRTGTRGGKDGVRHPDPGDAEGTAAVRDRVGAGHEAEADRLAEGMSDEEVDAANVEHLVAEEGVDRGAAERLVAIGRELDLAVRTVATDQEGDVFFRPIALPGVLQVNLNSNHPFYRDIWSVVHDEMRDEIPMEEAQERLDHVKNSLKLLLYSWARMEVENNDAGDQRIRSTWGKYLKEFLAHRPGL